MQVVITALCCLNVVWKKKELECLVSLVVFTTAHQKEDQVYLIHAS